MWETEGSVVHLVYKPFATRTGTKTECTYASVFLFTAELLEIGAERERVFFFKGFFTMKMICMLSNLR